MELESGHSALEKKKWPKFIRLNVWPLHYRKPASFKQSSCRSWHHRTSAPSFLRRFAPSGNAWGLPNHSTEGLLYGSTGGLHPQVMHGVCQIILQNQHAPSFLRRFAPSGNAWGLPNHSTEGLLYGSTGDLHPLGNACGLRTDSTEGLLYDSTEGLHPQVINGVCLLIQQNAGLHTKPKELALLMV